MTVLYFKSIIPPFSSILPSFPTRIFQLSEQMINVGVLHRYRILALVYRCRYSLAPSVSFLTVAYVQLSQH